jgi:PAS domain S-box-containing protein
MIRPRLRTVGWYLLQQAGLTIAMAVATRTGLYFAGSETHVPWLWPASGAGLAGLMLLGLRAWPALLIGGVIGRGGGSTDVAWTLAAVDTAQAVVGALVLRAWPSFRPDLSRLVDAFALVVTIAVSAIAGALVGTLATLIIGQPAWPSVGRGLVTWMVGTGMGGLLIAPPLMSWWGYRRHTLPSPARLVELGALVLALASAGMVAYFASVRGDVHSPLEYLPFPVAIWVAMRFGVRGATAATLVVSGVALAGHVLLEPAGTAAPSERETLLIQASLAVGALTSLLVGAVTTERNETMRALVDSEQRATALFAQAPDAIFMLEGERPHVGKVLAANPAAGDMHGVSPEALAGRHLADFQRPGGHEVLQRALENAPEDDRIRLEITHARDDGSMVDIEMHAQAFRVRGHRYLLAFDRDITERRRNEAEKAAMEEKLRETQKLESLGLLAGGIAHDFNNLLTGILGHANLARRSTVPSEIDACLEQVEQSTERAAELCGQMLAYAGKGRFEIGHVDLSAAVHETTSLIRASIGRTVRLELQLAMGLPIVEGDLTQIRQIIMNLVLNGAEATEDRAGVIRVTTGVMDADAAYLASTHLSPDLPEGSYVFLEVADNGRGMNAETVTRIFDPFFSTKFTGRGLGLAAVLGIVRGHNGALKVESQEGVGTTFRLLLPASTVIASAEVETVEPAPIWHGRGLALVVDDEPSVRHVATRMLVSMGFEVETAASGAEAAELLHERPAEAFSVVLLDLTMPGSRGDETYRELSAIRPGLPIILMSGYSHQEASTLFEGEDLAGFLQKPFRLDKLRELVRGATAAPVAASGQPAETAAMTVARSR